MRAAYVITFFVKAGSEDEFLELLNPVLDAMRHERTFENAVLHRDPEAPSRFMLYETWTDHDDVVQVQMHRDYRKLFWERLPDLLAEPAGSSLGADTKRFQQHSRLRFTTSAPYSPLPRSAPSAGRSASQSPARS